MKVMDTSVMRIQGRQRMLCFEELVGFTTDPPSPYVRQDVLKFHQGEESLFGFYLPKWQRDFCWSKEQQVRFVESVYLGYSLGSIVVTGGEGVWFTEFDRLLLDGQQRLTTLCNYMKDSFPVFGCYFSEVMEKKVRYPKGWYEYVLNGEVVAQLPRTHFLQTSIPMMEVTSTSEEYLKELYIRLNFGSTFHTLDDLKRTC